MQAKQQVQRTQRPVGDGIGLTVNTVTPGFIDTGMLATVPDKVLDRLRTQIPVGRLGAPEEIARVVCFLAADASSYITGQIWAVNGGRGCRITRDLHLSRQELYFDKISLFNCLPGKHSPEMMDCGL